MENPAQGERSAEEIAEIWTHILKTELLKQYIYTCVYIYKIPVYASHVSVCIVMCVLSDTIKLLILTLQRLLLLV